MITRAIGAGSLARDLGNWQDTADRRPAYRALADGIRLLVHDGRVPLGVALPSERELAAALALSRTTITSAYTALREAGYLRSRQGARSTVALPSGRTAAPARAGGPGPARAPETVDLSYASMPAPAAEIESAYAAALRSVPAYLDSHGMEPIGVAPLREVIARRYRERGLPTDADQIMVTSGAQHALRLLLGVLTDAGDRVIVDHPTYPNALEAIRRHGARPVVVPVRPEGGADAGWDLEGLRSAARQTAARMAFLIPDFHSPTGLCMGAQGRAELVRIAQETRMTLVVDETMVDLWLDTPPPPRGRLVRRGPVRRDGGIHREVPVGRAPGGLDPCRPVPDHAARGGTLRRRPRHAGDGAARRGAPARRRRRPARAAARTATPPPGGDARRARRAPARLEVHGGPGGMSLWVRMPTPVSTALAATAPNHGVVLAAGPRFGVEGAFERFLRLPYAREVDEVRRAVASVASAYDALARGRDLAEPHLVV